MSADRQLGFYGRFEDTTAHNDETERNQDRQQDTCHHFHICNEFVYKHRFYFIQMLFPITVGPPFNTEKRPRLERK